MKPDPNDPSLSVGVIGAGVMGRGIAQIAAAAGCRVSLSDVSEDAARDARAFASRMLLRQAEKGRITRAEAEAAVARVVLVPGLRDLADCTVVIEAVVEDLGVKQRLFAELETMVAETCVLASNTSSFSIGAIAAACARPERVAGAHFFNPVPLMKLVEVVAGERTDARVEDFLVGLVERMGHKAVRVKDVPLFLVNHAGRGYSTEALAVLDEGVATAVDIDRVMRETAGFPMGPFELFDLTGLNVSHPSLESGFHQFYAEPRMRLTPETRLRYEAGLFGRKSGAGFYRYIDGKIDRPSETPPPEKLPARVWVSQADGRGGERVAACLKAVADAVEMEAGDTPSTDALCLVTPFGVDATTAATEQGLDPRRTLAVDTLYALDRRVTLMATPVTEAAVREAGHGLFAAAGLPVTLIADSPGFVAQRILAAVVNIACAIAQQRISTPDEIDEAVRIGRGYPQGPLSLGDELGAERILAILDAMQRLTGDPRYRASPWLRRRVQLGVSLKTPDLAP
ncbi:MAG: 3-hydroxyacyl-CoA dehydrogenase [Rhodospirillales bacterium]|jgi:3-hydroxybutyryl-CoA dehydrogenase|nr:3-hydroxyacyl-CoA dehydrogenase [Rhodospirillales bacterium]